MRPYGWEIRSPSSVRGVLAQCDTPDRILAHPASEFVQRFIGPEPNLKRLGMIQVGQLPRHDVTLVDEGLSPIATAHPTVTSPPWAGAG